MLSEIKAMKTICPKATYGYLPNGRMYWLFEINTWKLLAVYSETFPCLDHAKNNFGERIRVYSVKSNYNEMWQMVKCSNVTPKTIIPHLCRDDDNQIYLGIRNRNYIYIIPESIFNGESIIDYYEMTKMYIECFDSCLNNQSKWSKWNFTGPGLRDEIETDEFNE